MNNNIQIANISPLQYIDGISRYASSEVIYYITNAAKYITFKTYVRSPIPTSSGDIFTVLEKQYEFRPDLLAFDVYKEPRLWWKILEANQIYDIYDFKVGINIRIPSLVF